MSKYKLGLEYLVRPPSGLVRTVATRPRATRPLLKAPSKGCSDRCCGSKSAEILPTRVEICSPIIYHTYTTNYGGPLRKSEQIRGGTSFQLVATVLINVCYRIYADVRASGTPSERMSTRARAWERGNGAHAYLEMFQDASSEVSFIELLALAGRNSSQIIGAQSRETRSRTS